MLLHSIQSIKEVIKMPRGMFRRSLCGDGAKAEIKKSFSTGSTDVALARSSGSVASRANSSECGFFVARLIGDCTVRWRLPVTQ